jgi:hypothetical protein
MKRSGAKLHDGRPKKLLVCFYMGIKFCPLQKRTCRMVQLGSSQFGWYGFRTKRHICNETFYNSTSPLNVKVLFRGVTEDTTVSGMKSCVNSRGKALHDYGNGSWLIVSKQHLSQMQRDCSECVDQTVAMCVYAVVRCEVRFLLVIARIWSNSFFFSVFCVPKFKLRRLFPTNYTADRRQFFLPEIRRKNIHNFRSQPHASCQIGLLQLSSREVVFFQF